MRKTSLATLPFLVGALLVAACSDDSASTPTPGGRDGGVDPVACAATGTGSINVTVVGLPAGVTLDATTQVVRFAGAADSSAAGPTTLDVAAGAYTASSSDVVRFAADPLVRTAYAATVSPASFCLGSGATQDVTVTFAPIPTSNKLWSINDNADIQLLGYASSALATTSTQASTVASSAKVGRSIAFDKLGNMWGLPDTVAEPALQRFAAGALAAGGPQTPDHTISLDAGCLPAFTDLAFAPNGDLYVSSACADKIFRFAAADLTSATPTPNLAITGAPSPEALAFDRDGNLWVADSTAAAVLRFDASALASGSVTAPSLTVTPEAQNGNPLPPSLLAFDRDGNLWASSFGGNALYRLTPTEQAGTGTRTLVPGIQVVVGVLALLEGMAFDESGALWLTLAQGTFGRVSAAQLGTSSTPGAPTAPEVVITGSNLSYAGGLAFYPPPSFSPIYGH